MASGTIKAVVSKSDIVNNLTTNDSTKVLSAAQGYSLNSNLTKSIKSVCPIAEGNTHSAFVAGMVIYIRNHPTLTEGSYTVTQYVAQNATLSDSNVTYNYYGGLDVLNGKLGTCKLEGNTLASGSSKTFVFTTCAIVYAFRRSSTTLPVVAFVDGWAGITYAHQNDSALSISATTGSLTITNNLNAYIDYFVLTA